MAPTSFSYTVSDGNGGMDTATVNVEVSSLPDHGARSFTARITSAAISGDVINLAHDDAFEVDQATIAFSFTADSVGGKQGLISKDARGYSGDGNHVSVYIHKGVLKARFQDGQSDTTLKFGGPPGRPGV